MRLVSTDTVCAASNSGGLRDAEKTQMVKGLQNKVNGLRDAEKTQMVKGLQNKINTSTITIIHEN